jgi:hypothetical protein
MNVLNSKRLGSLEESCAPKVYAFLLGVADSLLQDSSQGELYHNDTSKKACVMLSLF